MKCIFIHGNSSSPSVFEPAIVDKFNGDNISLPGHCGHISDNPAYDYSINGLREYVKRQLPTDTPFLLVAHSLGGHLAIEAAPQFTNCKGVVIFGAPPLRRPVNPEEAYLPSSAFGLFLKGEYNEEELDAVLIEITRKTEVREQIKEDFVRTDKLFRDYFAKSGLVDGELLDEVAIVENMQKPIYVIHGSEDPAPNLSYIKQLKGITEVFEIEDCGHYPSLEQPKKFTDILAKIVNKISSL